LSSFEEALENINAFCQVLAKKIASSLNQDKESEILILKTFEKEFLIQKLAQKTTNKEKHLEEPLIDVFETSKQVSLFLQCPVGKETIKLNREQGSIEMCCRDRCCEFKHKGQQHSNSGNNPKKRLIFFFSNFRK